MSVLGSVIEPIEKTWMQNQPLKQLQNSFTLICKKTCQRLQLSLNLFESHQKVRSAVTDSVTELLLLNQFLQFGNKAETQPVHYFVYWAKLIFDILTEHLVAGVWLNLVSCNRAPQGNLMFCMLSDENVFRELLWQHWNFDILFSCGNRRELLTHAVMFSGAIFHRKARASADF